MEQNALKNGNKYFKLLETRSCTILTAKINVMQLLHYIAIIVFNWNYCILLLKILDHCSVVDRSQKMLENNKQDAHFFNSLWLVSEG